MLTAGEMLSKSSGERNGHSVFFVDLFLQKVTVLAQMRGLTCSASELLKSA